MAENTPETKQQKKIGTTSSYSPMETFSICYTCSYALSTIIPLMTLVWLSSQETHGPSIFSTGLHSFNWLDISIGDVSNPMNLGLSGTEMGDLVSFVLAMAIPALLIATPITAYLTREPSKPSTALETIQPTPVYQIGSIQQT